jgi:hypothetical protein
MALPAVARAPETGGHGAESEATAGALPGLTYALSMSVKFFFAISPSGRPQVAHRIYTSRPWTIEIRYPE